MSAWHLHLQWAANPGKQSQRQGAPGGRTAAAQESNHNSYVLQVVELRLPVARATQQTCLGVGRKKHRPTRRQGRCLILSRVQQSSFLVLQHQNQAGLRALLLHLSTAGLRTLLLHLSPAVAGIHRSTTVELTTVQNFAR